MSNDGLRAGLLLLLLLLLLRAVLAMASESLPREVLKWLQSLDLRCVRPAPGVWGREGGEGWRWRAGLFWTVVDGGVLREVDGVDEGAGGEGRSALGFGCWLWESLTRGR